MTDPVGTPPEGEQCGGARPEGRPRTGHDGVDGSAHRQFVLPRVLGGQRRFLLGQLALVGFAQSACVVGFALALHALLGHVAHPGQTVFREAGLYRLLQGWSTTALVIALAVMALATVAAKAAGPPLAEKLAQNYVHTVRMRLFDHVSGSHAWATDRRAVGVTVFRFTGDSGALRGWVGAGVAVLLVNGVFLVCTIGMLVVMLPVAGLAAIAALLLSFGVAALLGLRLQASVWATRRSNGRLASFVNERVTHAAVMQSLGRIGSERRALSKRSRRFSREMVRQARLTGAIGAAAEAGRIGVLVAVIVGAMVAHVHADTLTSLVSIAGFLSGPLSDLAGAQEAWQRSKIARRRINQVIGVPARLTTRQSTPPLEAGPGGLTLRELALGGVLGDINATVQPAQRVAVEGPTGSGKSLLLGLVARLHPPDRGVVLLDGQDLARHDPVSVGRAVRLVSPDLPLLRGSVEANLKHGDVPEAELDEVSRHCRAALEPVLTRLEKVLADQLPNGLRSMIGEGGYGLSTAYTFHVALARALRSGPRVLLLDWPDADLAVDREILDDLFAHYPGTLLYVTRDEGLLDRADLRWWVDNQTLTTRRPLCQNRLSSSPPPEPATCCSATPPASASTVTATPGRSSATGSTWSPTS